MNISKIAATLAVGLFCQSPPMQQPKFARSSTAVAPLVAERSAARTQAMKPARPMKDATS